MNADANNRAVEIEASEAQFGLRALLGVMTLVAVFASIAGFAIRRFPAESRALATVVWGSLLGAVVVYFVWGLRRRKLAEKQAGPTLMQVAVASNPRSVYWIGWRLVFGLSLFTFIWLIACDSIADFSRVGGRGGLISLAFPSILYVSWLQQTVESLWNRRLRVCEQGVLWGCNLLPWSNVMEFRWAGFDNGRLELRGINDSRKQPWASVPIPAENRAAVTELLEAKLAGVPRLPASASWVGFGEVSVARVMQTSHFRRHLAFATIDIVCTVLLFYWGLILGTGTREFEQTIFILPFIAIFLAPPVWQQFLKRSGIPIARVFARRDLLGFVANMSMATGIYWISASLMLWPYWLGYTAAIAYSYFTIKTASYYFLTQLDFCVNSVVIPGAFYWPWGGIKVHYWAPEQSGRLVLGRKWRRVTAIVPQEQRETVDRVLRDRLGTSEAATQPQIQVVADVVS